MCGRVAPQNMAHDDGIPVGQWTPTHMARFCHENCVWSKLPGFPRSIGNQCSAGDWTGVMQPCWLSQRLQQPQRFRLITPMQQLSWSKTKGWHCRSTLWCFRWFAFWFYLPYPILHDIIDYIGNHRVLFLWVFLQGNFHPWVGDFLQCTMIKQVFNSSSCLKRSWHNWHWRQTIFLGIFTVVQSCTDFGVCREHHLAWVGNFTSIAWLGIGFRLHVRLSTWHISMSHSTDPNTSVLVRT